MKKTFILLFAAAIVGCNNADNTAESTTTAVATDTTAAVTTTETPAPAPKLDSATIMKNMADFMTPGEMQKMLASMNGRWSARVVTWWEDKSDTSTATVEYSMLMGGRFQQMKLKGTMMGMPFEGMGITGYDNLRKVMTNSWTDNMSTSVMYMEGPYDATAKSFELKGKGTNPETGGTTDMREVFKIIDDKTQHMEMYGMHEGKEVKMLEMDLVKK
jgi:hypothetical protein